MKSLKNLSSILGITLVSFFTLPNLYAHSTKLSAEQKLQLRKDYHEVSSLMSPFFQKGHVLTESYTTTMTLIGSNPPQVFLNRSQSELISLNSGLKNRYVLVNESEDNEEGSLELVDSYVKLVKDSTTIEDNELEDVVGFSYDKQTNVLSIKSLIQEKENPEREKVPVNFVLNPRNSDNLGSSSFNFNQVHEGNTFNVKQEMITYRSKILSHEESRNLVSSATPL